MSFLRHEEVYPSDGGAGMAVGAPAHRLDEFPAGNSLVGCSPPESASASPAGHRYAVMSSFRSMDFQRPENSVLTVCLTPRGQAQNGTMLSSTWYPGNSKPRRFRRCGYRLAKRLNGRKTSSQAAWGTFKDHENRSDRCNRGDSGLDLLQLRFSAASD